MYKIEIILNDGTSVPFGQIFERAEPALEAAASIASNGIGVKDSQVDLNSSFSVYGPTSIKLVKVIPNSLVL